jgi:hypothetical protein
MSRKRRIFGIVAAGLFVVAMAGGITLYIHAQVTSDDAQIQRVVNKFAVSIARVDYAGIYSSLCQEEAESFADTADFDPTDPADNPVAAKPESQFSTSTTSDIRIVGDVASAKVTRSAKYSTTLYFRKENGQWKVCAPAADQLPVASGRH